MAEHPAYRHGVAQENPFAPVPPPPRRTAPNSRPGLTDGIIPTDDPFGDRNARAPSIRSLSPTSNSRHKGGVAAGIAAAAAGGGLVHEHDKHKDEHAILTNANPVRGPPVSRKPVPVRHVNNGEPWPYSPVSPIDSAAEMAALTTKDPTRTSDDSRRSFSRDAGRANAAFDQQYALPQDGGRSNSHGLEAGLAGLAAGATGGAALAHHADQERRRSRSSSSSNGNGSSNSNNNRRTRPPLAAPGDDSDHSSSREGRSKRGGSYGNAHVSPPPSSPQQQHSDPYGVPLAPASRSRRNSGHGPAAPGTAVAFPYTNRPTVPSPLSSEVRPDTSSGYSHPRNRARRSTSGGSRYSFPYEPLDHDYGAYPVFSAPYAGHTSYGNAASNEALPSLPSTSTPTPPQQPIPTANPYPRQDKAIVGDNRYPHLNVPRRKSGGEDDALTGPLGTPTLPPSAQPPDDERIDLGTSRNAATMKRWTGDDSTWRVSAGMPSGWQRASVDSPRNSRDLGNRDSGVGMHAGRRRLRASDFAGIEDGPYHGLGQAL
ncbi:hypothetical protein PV04_06521 [Phialophora macrospora]|uniref:Uncharacterized protein n=1 Tax=Phialophora macrospora TaxID=1851006 RepID=A0A0D2CQ08_9EURO|nr:hypothetical protein PV04_06521 [Phialophora macrospora]